jgi:hypothetical protein
MFEISCQKTNRQLQFNRSKLPAKPPTNTHYVNTYIRSNIFSSKKYSKLLCLCWTKIFHKIKNFPQNNHKHIITQSFAVIIFVCILFVQILRKLFLTRDLADCARVLILSRHNNFYRVIKMLSVSEIDVTNQKQYKLKCKSYNNKWSCQLLCPILTFSLLFIYVYS